MKKYMPHIGFTLMLCAFPLVLLGDSDLIPMGVFCLVAGMWTVLIGVIIQ
jgi:hypothetical protein